MKTRLKILIPLLLLSILSFGFAPQPPAISIKIATATAGGVWNPMGVALGKLITQYVPGVSASAMTTGGAVENLKLLSTGKVDLAYAYDYHVTWLNAGKLPGVTAGKVNARIVLGLYEHPLHIITRKGAGVAGLADLKGKRVSTGAAGSGAEEQAGYVFKALGLELNKDIQRQKLSLTDSADALKADKIDAFFWSGPAPSDASTAALAGLAADAKVKMTLLPLSGDLADKIMQANPQVFHPTLIKKGEYSGQEADVQTLAVTAVLAALDTFPAAQLTAILGAVFDHKADLVPVWKGAADLTPEKSLAVLAPATRAYLHPAAAALLQNRETIFQVSTYTSLATGHLDGFETVAWLKSKGDLGTGTIDGLDGEMIMLDGQVYQVKSTGQVVQVPETSLTPFAAVTKFDADITQDLGPLPDLAALQAALLKMIPHKDAFYAIRVHGQFSQLQARSVPKQVKPYPELAQVIKTQSVFDLKNVTGTLVGFWSPDYIGGVNVAGFHLHFISDDRTAGGHLLAGSLTQGQASLDETRNFQMELDPAGQ